MIVSTEREQRQQWLNSLKVGDEVFVSNRHHARITVITKITPTRRMTVSAFPTTYFDNAGYQKGDTWNRLELEPVTDEIRNKLLKSETIAFLKHFRWEHLSPEKMLKILEIIKEETK